MNKVYFFAPLAALLVFIVVYSSHRGELKARETAKAAEVVAANKARLERERVEREAAMAEAIKAAEARKVEKAAKDARDKAFRDQEKGARQLERLKKDIETEQSALAKLAAERAAAESEKVFLLDFVDKAQANAQALQALITRLSAPAPAPAPVSK